MLLSNEIIEDVVAFTVPHLTPPSVNHHTKPCKYVGKDGYLHDGRKLTAEATAYKDAVAIFSRGRTVAPLTNSERRKVKYRVLVDVYLGCNPQRCIAARPIQYVEVGYRTVRSEKKEKSRMRTNHFIGVTMHCVVCQREIPPDRPKMAITCSDECSKARKNFRRSRQDSRMCRYCLRPSTPEQRLAYHQWRRRPQDAEEEERYRLWRLSEVKAAQLISRHENKRKKLAEAEEQTQPDPQEVRP